MGDIELQYSVYTVGNGHLLTYALIFLFWNKKNATFSFTIAFQEPTERRLWSFYIRH